MTVAISEITQVFAVSITPAQTLTDVTTIFIDFTLLQTPTTNHLRPINQKLFQKKKKKKNRF